MSRDRVAVVTGGASGIGRETVVRLATQGLSVVVADRDRTAAAALAGELGVIGRNVEPFELDLLATDEIGPFWDHMSTAYGRCDVLVNCAGIASLRPLAEVGLADWSATLTVNVTGLLLMAQGASRLMARNQWGRVVNVSSVSGFRAGVGRTSYGTSKSALTGLTRQLAIELASANITVNAVAPGPVSTPLADASHSQATRDAYKRLVPMGRYATVAEVAAAILFLCSDDAAYITGHTIPVDGGFLAAGVLQA